MQYGLYVPAPIAVVGSPEIAQSIAQSRQPLPAGHRDAAYDFNQDFLLVCDACGFDLALFAERHLGSDLGAWVISSAIAPRFQNMRPLVAVHPGLFNPAIIAKLAASLDRICAKRMAINIVNGWYEQEFEMFGGTVLKDEARYRRSVEFIDILRGLWREEKFSYSGEHYSMKDGELMLKPAGKEPPEIFSVSNTELGRNFIAESCDWWFVGMPKEPDATHDDAMRMLEASIRDMDKLAARYGRKVHYALNPFMAVGSSTESALKKAVEGIFAYETNPEARSPDRVRQIERRMLPATKAGLIGKPEDIRRQVRRFEDMGFELLLLKFVTTRETARELGEHVLMLDERPPNRS